MRWLHKLLIRICYWRHTTVTMYTHRYIGGARAEFWCTHCGGTIVARSDAKRPRSFVVSSSCPVGREYMRLDPP